MLLPESEFFESYVTTLHAQRSKLVLPSHRKNSLLIILPESLGADFVGKLGGQNLTPNIDKFAGQGIWFDNLYTTGTRSVRGIEAVIIGFYPHPLVVL